MYALSKPVEVKAWRSPGAPKALLDVYHDTQTARFSAMAQALVVATTLAQAVRGTLL